jgi:hypothetical protein
MGIPVDNSELVTVVDFRRSMTRFIDELREGEREKVILTRHGRMQCVVLTIPEYEKLLK